jgi:hypothetical protein
MIEECQWCEQVLDDGEKLYPVWIGSPPQPEVTRAKGFVPKSVKSETVAFGSEDGGVQVLGKPIDEIHAIINAIESCDEMELKTYRRVEEAFGVDRVTQNPKTEIESRTNTRVAQEVSARIVVKPTVKDKSPDIKVCKYCKEMLQND